MAKRTEDKASDTPGTFQLYNIYRPFSIEQQTCCSGISSCNWDLRSCICRNTISIMPRPHKVLSQGTKEDEVSYEIGSALHLQPSDTTQRAGLLRLAAVNTHRKRKSQQQAPKNQRISARNTEAPQGSGLPTTRDRSLETAVRPRKNAMAGALGYRTCEDTATISSGHRS